MCHICLKASILQNNHILRSLRRETDATKFQSPMISHKLPLQSDPTDGNRTRLWRRDIFDGGQSTHMDPELNIISCILTCFAGQKMRVPRLEVKACDICIPVASYRLQL
jgi:hypothetical protein